MLRVAAVGKYLAESFVGEAQSQNIVATLLLHDLGNLLKFDLVKGLNLLDESERNLEYWTEKKKQLQEQYSSDEHQATFLMAKETSANDKVLFILQHMGSSHLSETLESDDWELKICSYSDFRVGPFGYLTVEERFKNILERYEGSSHVLSDRPKTIEKMLACLALEDQLRSRISADMDTLPVEELERSARALENFEI